MTREQFEKVVAGLDEAVGQEAVRQAREDGQGYEQFRQALGTHAAGFPEVLLRRGYAAALMDEGISGVTARQAQALHDALMADAELRWDFPQDGCHARGVLMVEAMLEMGVCSTDIGKVYAFHRDHAVGGGWRVTTLDGQFVHWSEHVVPTVLDRNGQPVALDPATAGAPRGVSAWTTGLGAPDFQHAPQTVSYAQIMLGRMNSGNVAHMLNGIQRLNPAAHHYLISEPTARDQLRLFGATLPPAPELGWRHLQGRQRNDAARFLRDLSREYRTGAIIAVAYGEAPLLDVAFNTASPHGAGVPEARRYLASLYLMEKTAMHTGFYHIQRIDEESNGLRMTFEEAPPGLLRSDHPQFQQLRDLLCHQLHEATTQVSQRPTWLAIDENRIIADVRMVAKGVPLSARRDDSGAYLIVFPLTNVARRLSSDHPRFREFERDLLLALEHESPLYFVASAESFCTIDDMVPSLSGVRPLKDAGVVEVPGATVLSQQLNNPSPTHPPDT